MSCHLFLHIQQPSWIACNIFFRFNTNFLRFLPLNLISIIFCVCPSIRIYLHLLRCALLRTHLFFIFLWCCFWFCISLALSYEIDGFIPCSSESYQCRSSIFAHPTTLLNRLALTCKAFVDSIAFHHGRQVQAAGVEIFCEMSFLPLHLSCGGPSFDRAYSNSIISCRRDFFLWFFIINISLNTYKACEWSFFTRILPVLACLALTRKNWNMGKQIWGRQSVGDRPNLDPSFSCWRTAHVSELCRVVLFFNVHIFVCTVSVIELEFLPDGSISEKHRVVPRANNYHDILPSSSKSHELVDDTKANNDNADTCNPPGGQDR